MDKQTFFVGIFKKGKTTTRMSFEVEGTLAQAKYFAITYAIQHGIRAIVSDTFGNIVFDSSKRAGQQENTTEKLVRA